MNFRMRCLEERTFRMVLINTSFALDKIKKVVCGLVFAFAAFKARTMAGCWERDRENVNNPRSWNATL